MPSSAAQARRKQFLTAAAASTVGVLLLSVFFTRTAVGAWLLPVVSRVVKVVLMRMIRTAVLSYGTAAAIRSYWKRAGITNRAVNRAVNFFHAAPRIDKVVVVSGGALVCWWSCLTAITYGLPLAYYQDWDEAVWYRRIPSFRYDYDEYGNVREYTQIQLVWVIVCWVWDWVSLACRCVWQLCVTIYDVLHQMHQQQQQRQKQQQRQGEAPPAQPVRRCPSTPWPARTRDSNPLSEPPPTPFTERGEQGARLLRRSEICADNAPPAGQQQQQLPHQQQQRQQQQQQQVQPPRPQRCVGQRSGKPLHSSISPPVTSAANGRTRYSVSDTESTASGTTGSDSSSDSEDEGPTAAAAAAAERGKRGATTLARTRFGLLSDGDDDSDSSASSTSETSRVPRRAEALHTAQQLQPSISSAGRRKLHDWNQRRSAAAYAQAAAQWMKWDTAHNKSSSSVTRSPSSSSTGSSSSSSGSSPERGASLLPTGQSPSSLLHPAQSATALKQNEPARALGVSDGEKQRGVQAGHNSTKTSAAATANTTTTLDYSGDYDGSSSDEDSAISNSKLRQKQPRQQHHDACTLPHTAGVPTQLRTLQPGGGGGASAAAAKPAVHARNSSSASAVNISAVNTAAAATTRAACTTVGAQSARSGAPLYCQQPKLSLKTALQSWATKQLSAAAAQISLHHQMGASPQRLNGRQHSNRHQCGLHKQRLRGRSGQHQQQQQRRRQTPS
jgi:hypothetical protein